MNRAVLTAANRLWIRYLLLAFLPALLLLLWLTVMRLSGTPVCLLPTNSDEMAWYQQIGAMVTSGYPLGYYGYDGTHAAWGTFGPWGIFILLPFGLFGKLFGWGPESMCIANVCFLGLSLTLFAWLGRLTASEVNCLVIAYCCLLMNLFYCSCSMGEALRWSMAILLSGCMVRIYRGYGGKLFRYLVVPLLLLWCTEAYLLLALFIPIYLLLVLPIKKLPVKLAVTGALTCIAAFSLRKLLHMICSPYTGNNSSASTWKELLRERADNMIEVLQKFFPSTLWENRVISYGFPSLIVLTFCILLLYCAVMLFRRRHDPDGLGYLAAVFFFCGIAAAYALVYSSPSFWTLCRGVNLAVVCVVLLFAVTRNRTGVVLCVLCALLTLPSFFRMSQSNLTNRCKALEEAELTASCAEKFSTLFDISAENDLWENTIATYGERLPGAQNAITLAFPVTAGYNTMLDSSVVCPARYAVVYRSYSEEGKYERILENLQASGYEVSYQHEELTVLTRTAS